MRVLLISAAAPPTPCGVGDFTARLAQALALEGHHVALLTGPGPNGPPAPIAGVTLLESRRGWGAAALPALAAAARAWRPEVINLQYPTVGYGRGLAADGLPWILRAALRRPLITTIHEYLTFHRLGRTRVRLLAAASHAVVLPDPLNAAALRPFLAPERRFVIPLGANITPPTPRPSRKAARLALGGAPEEFWLAYFGFVGPDKGLSTLIAAAEQLATAAPQLAFRLLLLTGKPAAPAALATWEALNAQVSASPLADRVTWTGHLPAAAVSQYLLASDLGVLPFRDGASPRRSSLMSVLAHGLPLVSTLGPAVGSLGACCGLALAPPEDAAALAQTLSELLRQPERRAALRSAALDYAKTFAWPHIARQTAAIYAQFCA